MNWDQIEGKWTQLKGKAKEQWGNLTDDDLDRAAGNRDQLAGRVQERYGLAKEEAVRQVDEWAHGMKSYPPHTHYDYDEKSGKRAEQPTSLRVPTGVVVTKSSSSSVQM